MTKKEWRVKSPDIEKSSALAVRLEVSPLVAQLLVNRGIETVETAQTYLYPTLSNLHDPFLMHDMEKAVDRIHAAREKGEQIWVYGDYDTDGTTAVALLLSVFRELDAPVRYYIPDRFRGGVRSEPRSREGSQSEGVRSRHHGRLRDYLSKRGETRE